MTSLTVVKRTDTKEAELYRGKPVNKSFVQTRDVGSLRLGSNCRNGKN